jgi:virginiamycin B lyase
VARIDAATGSILDEVTVGDTPASIAVGEGAVWVANQGDGTVSRIDPATNEVTASVPAEGCWNVAVGGGQVWVPIGDHTEGFVRRGKLIP